ncbi:ornithine cyclodeaminase [[Eubacterium] contortum]|uniref:Ornithine cyclodeaminase n=1 Tax=Faecalicatena contorta TaxID=39482 RepID=A0A174DKK5_9FIRM|nr:tyramine oxidase subunit B [Faecalicatena contorta]CUO25974.1 ornithine cyclodeaminase [[Eubacterium] contortum] [Faecalicatena contorta]
MPEKIDFKYLNENDMLAVGVADMKGCLKAMEDMFVLIQQNDYRMGGENANEHGIRVTFPQTSDIEGMPTHKPDFRFMAMPAYLGGRFHIFGIKSYGSNPDNTEKELPRSILMMSLMDVDTGIPLAYMSANILSAMRTGAVSGVGAKYLCKKNVETVAIIGPGTMSRYTMDAFMEVQPTIKTVKIKGRGKTNIELFISFCKENYPGIEDYVVCNTLSDVCKDADIIFFGTTNASKYEDNPTVKKEWVKQGALVISASALLVDTSFLSAPEVKLISDNYKMYEEWGAGHPTPTQRNVSTLLGMGFYDAVTEGKISRTQITDIGEIISGEKSGRDDDSQIILYAVGGMPIEDVAWAHDCFKNALKKNIGVTLNLWDKPAL